MFYSQKVPGNSLETSSTSSATCHCGEESHARSRLVVRRHKLSCCVVAGWNEKCNQRTSD